MAEWRVFAHPNYFTSFRHRVTNPEERFRVTTAMRARLAEIEALEQDAFRVPHESGQYELEVEGYTIIFRLGTEQPNDIVLLEIY